MKENHSIQEINLTRAEDGQAMVEFLFIAITFLFCILGVIQLAMALNAYSMVKYAAYNAARAGIVHNGNRDVMREAARISLLATSPLHGRADHRLGLMENYEAAVLTDQDTSLTHLGDPITDVKIFNKDSVGCGEVITFDDYTQANQMMLTVQVVHNYELVIPLVKRIIYFVYWKFRQGEGYQGQTLDNLSRETDKLRRTGEFRDIEYRIPIVSTYTMHMQSDFIGDCS